MTAAKKRTRAAGGEPPAAAEAAELELARQLAERARAEGLQLTGPGGLLGRLTKIVLEAALEGELDDHLGYARHDPAGRDGGNSRNGHRAKTVLTDVGPVEIDVPRDRDGQLRAADRGQAAAAAGRGRRPGDLPGRQGPDHRRGPGAPGRDLRRRGVPGDDLHDHRPGAGAAWPSGSPGRWTRSTRCCSSTSSTSRSATARSPTGPSTSSSASPSTASGTSWACGPASTATARAPSTGCGC